VCPPTRKNLHTALLEAQRQRQTLKAEGCIQQSWKLSTRSLSLCIWSLLWGHHLETCCSEEQSLLDTVSCFVCGAPTCVFQVKMLANEWLPCTAPEWRLSCNCNIISNCNADWWPNVCLLTRPSHLPATHLQNLLPRSWNLFFFSFSLSFINLHSLFCITIFTKSSSSLCVQACSFQFKRSVHPVSSLFFTSIRVFTQFHFPAFHLFSFS